ncbi:hypothetical protein HD599_003185 [Conyzicola lurida]|uniref:YtxH domain-containing protein n=1 Tax=Conyzicola lurida TaxID=1172621 RepID=A0A841ASE0_9MICO|nr:YtxH domain-containing protein [Conyzicola lurida]MBB5844862.1 hypothetical protein [Conyzicola lurida]
MKGKILLVVGIGVGYVLGARAGRERYEDIKRAVGNVWNSPRVQRQFDEAEGFVKDKAPEVAGFLASGAKKVVSQVAGKPAAKPAARKSPTKSASKSTASKSASK